MESKSHPQSEEPVRPPPLYTPGLADLEPDKAQDAPLSYHQSNREAILLNDRNLRNPEANKASDGLRRNAAPNSTMAKLEADRRRFITRVRYQSVFADTLRDVVLEAIELDLENHSLPEAASVPGEQLVMAPQRVRTSATTRHLKAIQAQLDEISDSVGNTCQWIYGEKEYIDWLGQQDVRRGVLVVRAAPAYGKTVLMKSIFSRLEEDENTAWAFFCKREVSGRDNTSSVLASFIYQLLCQNPTLVSHISEAWLKIRKLGFADLWGLFDDLLRDHQVRDHIFLVDAVDECDPSSQKELYDALRSWDGIASPRLLITTRISPYSDARLTGQHFREVRISPDTVAKDAARFIDFELRLCGAIAISEPDMVKLLKLRIAQGTQGMFLVIQDRLRQFKLRRKVSTFPTPRRGLQKFFGRSSGSLTQFYSDLVWPVSRLNEDQRSKAASLLSIVLASQTSFENANLNAALEFSGREFDDYDGYLNADKETDIIESTQRFCGSIVKSQKNDRDRKIISLVHPSAREFLEAEGDPNSSDTRLQFVSRVSEAFGHVLLAKACLRFLLLPDIWHVDKAAFRKYPFLSYSMFLWQRHVRKSKERVTEYGGLLAAFLAPSSAGYREWDSVMRWDKPDLDSMSTPEMPTPAAISLVLLNLMNVLNMIEKNAATSSWTLFGKPFDIEAADEEGRTALCIAITQKNFDAVRVLIKLGASVNKTTVSGRTPLDYAAAFNSVQMIEELIGHGAVLDACTSEDTHSGGWTILREAVRGGHLDVVKKIMERNLIQDVNCKSTHGSTALIVAAEFNESLDVIKYLVLEQKADVDAATVQGVTALYAAVHGNKLDTVSFLLPLTRNKNPTSKGWTPLHVAAIAGNIEMTTLLIEGGFNIDAVSDDNITPLASAIEWKQYDIATLLVRRGADVNIMPRKGRGPLCESSDTGQYELVDALLKAGANPWTSFGTSMSCLHLAAHRGHMDCVRAIVAARGEQTYVDDIEATSGWTPLYAAIDKNHIEVANFLLDVGADPKVVPKGTKADASNILYLAAERIQDMILFRRLAARLPREFASAPGVTGRTPLHAAATAGFVGAMKALLELGVDATVSDDNYSTPLYCAACSGSSEAVQLLIENENLPNVQNKFGWTALLAASRNCNASTVQSLLKRTNWLSRRRSSSTPLQLAIHARNEEAINTLLEGGVPHDLCSNTGTTALHSAAEIGNLSLIIDLLKRGADVNARDDRNISPIILAYKFRDENLWQLLRPTTKGRSWKDRIDLVSPLQRAAGRSLSEVKWAESHGNRLFCKCSIENTPLGNAVDYSRYDVIEYLLHHTASQGVNHPISICGWTPVHLAARKCDSRGLELLARSPHIDLEKRDYLGLTSLDYASRHRPSFLALAATDLSKARTWHSRRESESCRRRQFMIQQVHRLISWKLEVLTELEQKESVKRAFLHIAMVTLTVALFMLGEDEEDELNSRTAYEILIGEPGSDLEPIFCDYCERRLKVPSLDGNEIKQTIFLCKSCPSLAQICYECKKRCEEEGIRGCYEHDFFEMPGISWFKRSSKTVNDKRQSKKEWLEDLKRHFEALKDEDLDTSELPGLMIDYESGRPSVFDMLSTTDLSRLISHLEMYPRDIYLRTEDGRTITMRVLQIDATDDEIVGLLCTLATEGANMLDHDYNMISTVELACRRGYEQCLTFLLEQYDPEFEKTVDPFSSEALQVMIDKKWTKALEYAIKRHFDWSTSGKFDWVQRYPSLGLTDDDIVMRLLTYTGDIGPKPTSFPV